MQRIIVSGFILIFISWNHFAVADELEIQTNYCFGNTQHVFLEGRVIEQREAAEVTRQSDSVLKNMWFSVRQFFNEEEENEPVNLRIGEALFQTHTDDEGYFLFDLNLTAPLPIGSQQVDLFLKRGKAKTRCELRVFGGKRETAIISDFDDTVIVSDVGDKSQLLANILTKNYKQREAVQGMAELFATGLTDSAAPLFFVTGSPRQMQKSIEMFLDYHHFPKNIIITKKLEGKGSDPLFDQLSYKTQKIEKLFKLFPDFEFILVGDDGEKDPEVYYYLQNRYPDRVKAVWIRKVSQDMSRETYPVQRHFSNACDINPHMNCH